jgi:hypothetical protein
VDRANTPVGPDPVCHYFTHRQYAAAFLTARSLVWFGLLLLCLPAQAYHSIHLTNQYAEMLLQPVSTSL